MYILLDTAKQHLNVDKDFHEDDNYILHLIQVSEDAIAKRIDQKLEDIVDPKTGYLPKSVIQSILILIGQFYANREATINVSANEIPIGLNWLADLNKKYLMV